jgi:hypothetical protein
VIISDVGKLALIGVFVVGLFVLVLTGTVEWGEAAPFFTLVAGYLFGNGAAAVRKSAPSPVVVANVPPGEMATVHGPVTGEHTAQGSEFWTDDNGSV